MNRNPDIQQLVDKGYAVAFDSNYLVVRDIPYLDSAGALKMGAIVATLVYRENNEVAYQDDHQIFFAGGSPYQIDAYSKATLNLAGETYVTGAWPGEDTAYRVAALRLPSQFGEMLQRKADHYETLLGILKVLAHTPEAPFWRERADAAIANAEAILAGAPDAEIAGGEP